jgi:tetratricopeptide (TPR) repeat protein
MRRGFVLLFAVAMFAAAGCASRHTEEHSSLSAQPKEVRDKFEETGDPPITADTHFAAAQLAESQNNAAIATKQYEEALKLDPKHMPSMYHLAMLYTQTKQYPKAIDAWQHYVKATNGKPNAYSNLGFCYELAGETDHAEEAYHKGIAADSRNQACRVNYGLMLARTGKINDAINQLSVVLTPAQVHYNVGSVYEQQGKREQAKAEYKKSIELDPNFLDAQTRLDAMILRTVGAAQ